MAHPRGTEEPGKPAGIERGRRAGLLFGLAFAWLAAALYVRSAVALISFLANRWGTLTIDGDPSLLPWPAAGWNLALLLAFAVSHSLLVRPAGQALLQRLVPAPWVRSLYVALAALSLAVVLKLWQPIPLEVWSVRADGFRQALWVLFAAGWGLAFVATRFVGHFGLFGLAQAWAAFRGREMPEPRLQVSGLYRRLRHPMYLGFLIGSWATPTMTAGHLLFAVTMTLYVLVGARLEERDLIARFGGAYLDYRARTPAWGPRGVGWVVGLLVLALVHAAVVGWRSTQELEDAWRAVRRQSGDRPFEGRLVPFDSHAPWQQAPPRAQGSDRSAGAAERGDDASEELTWDAFEGSSAGERRTDTEELFFRGTARVATARSVRDLDDGIAMLERARELAPRDANTLNNLAAAYAERDRGADRFLALEALCEAIELAPRRRDVRFNLAVTLSRFGIVPVAERAWDAYLALESDPSWRHEAIERRAALEDHWDLDRLLAVRPLELRAEAALAKLVRDHPQAATEWAETVLPETWAEAKIDGDEPLAAAALRALRITCGELNGNELPGAIWRALERLDRSRWLPVASAVLALRDGRAAYLARDYAAAETPLNMAETGLAKELQGLALWARFFRLAAQFTLDNETIVQPFEDLVQVAERLGYARLVGYSDLMLGLAHAERMEHAAAFEAYHGGRAALASAELSGEVAYLDSTLSDAYRRLAQGHRQWEPLLRAAAGAPEISNPRWRVSIWTGVAKTLAEQGMPRAAVLFADEAVREAENSPWPSARSMALTDRADLLAASEARDKAQADVRAAWDAIRTFAGNRGAYARQLAALLGVVGRHGLEISDLDSIDALSQAIEYQASSGGEIALPGLYVERARRLSRAGTVNGALADLHAAAALLDERPLQSTDPRDRAGFLDIALHVFDPWVEMSFDGDPTGRAGLEVVQSFLSLRGDRLCVRCESDETIPLEKVPQNIGQRAALLVLWSTAERTLAWWIDEAGPHQQALPVSSARVRDLGLEVERALRGRRGDAPARANLAALYSELLAPFADRLRRAESLYVLADSRFGSLPWDALLDEQSGRFLVETHSVQAIPDAASLRVGARAEPVVERRALLVGNPKLDAALYPNLKALPSSRREISDISAHYPGATVLLEEGATKASVLRRLPAANVFVFAGHATSSQGGERLAALLLASGSTAEGGADLAALGSLDVAPLDLSGMELAVLSACSSGSTPGRSGGSLFQLSTPFLLAGAHQVVTTLWPVRDEETRRFMVRFHDLYAQQSLSPTTALRRAKLEALEQGYPLDEWAVYQIVTRELGLR